MNLVAKPRPCAVAPRVATSSARYLPVVPRPPHDPLTWLLDARVGWQPLASAASPATIVVRPGDGALVPRLLASGGRRWDDGSFGGLALPSHVAWAGDGECERTLLLYDVRGRRMLRLDRCTCCFEEWFCFGGNDARLPQAFGGMSTSCAQGAGRLYLLDTARRLVIVLNATTGALRGVVRAPLAIPGGTLAAWQPRAIAIDEHGALWVADAASGTLLHFAPDGRVRYARAGIGTVVGLAVDRDGLVWMLHDDGSVTTFDRHRDTLAGVTDSPKHAALHFPPLHVRVAADGSVEVGALCLPPVPLRWFDRYGDCLEDPPAIPPDAYATPAQWWSGPLDSGIAECVWDRIVIDADVPEHALLAIHVLTAETELPGDLVVDSDGWVEAIRVVTGVGDAPVRRGLDAMLRAPGGRYLWVRVAMRAGIGAAPTLLRVRIDYPRISWRRYLPAVFGAEATAAEFTDRFLAIFDRTFRGIEARVDGQASLFDPASAPPAFLDFLAQWIGADAAAVLPLARRREFVKHAAKAYAWRGTPAALTQTLYLFLGLSRWCEWDGPRACCVPCPTRMPERLAWRPPALLLEHYALRRWIFLGGARLSDNAKLWASRIVNRAQLGADASAGKGACLPGPLPGDPPEPCVSATYSTAHDESAARGSARIGIAQLKTTQDPWRDPFHYYAHQLSVFVPASCVREPGLRRALARLLALEAPAHVKVNLIAVEPRMRVGVQSSLGLDAVIGWRAQAPTLDQSPLGRATVLGGSDRRLGGDRGSASLRIGARRVGMDTTLQ